MRTALACNLSPLLIRIALGITFLWAGASKVFYIDDFSGGAAAGLANAGVQPAIDAAQPVQAPPIVPAPAPVPVEPVPTPRPAPDAPVEPINPINPIEPVEPVEPIEPVEDDEFAREPNGNRLNSVASPVILPAVYFTQAESPNAASIPPTPPAPTTTPSSPTLRPYTPEQFPETTPIKLRRLHGLILAMDNAHQRNQWPDFLATAQAYSALAWAAALTELFAGIFLLVGFLTRLAGLGVAGVMAGAMWMTQIGPSIGTSDAFLGILPALRLDEGGEWVGAWKELLWQFALLMMGLAIFFSGPGRLAIDALLFSPGRDTRRDIDE